MPTIADHRNLTLWLTLLLDWRLTVIDVIDEVVSYVKTAILVQGKKCKILELN